MQKYLKNIYIQCLFVTLIWQLALYPLYLYNFITYNPLIELSDILPNLFFIFFISLLFSSPVFALILLSLIYMSGVVLYYFTRQNLTITQVNNIPELISIYSPTSFFIIVLLVSLIYFSFKFSKKFNYLSQKTKPRIIQIIISIILLLLITFGTQSYFPKISKHNTENFNKFATWKHGGQLYSIIYHYAEKRNMIIKFEKISGEISPELKFINDPQSNLIMIILLESFVPRSDTNPKNFEPFLNDHGFKSIIMESPAYGGYSAKSEFEILCGLPELQPLGDMSFNFFGGKDTEFCIPSLLSKYNFDTISITGTKPHFHNANNAYPSLGFQKIISKNDLNNDDLDGIHPSDKSIYDYAFNEIINRKKNNLFLYLFTAAGHGPYELNNVKRPRLTEDKYHDRIYYTEKELKDFIIKLDQLNLKISLIIASDHATESSKLNRNNKLLNVWYRSDNLNDFNKNCSQYFEISKYFTEQECDKLNKTDNELIGRNKNFPLYNQIETLILKLLKKSQK